MNLDDFISRDLAAFLRGFRPLEGWEQLHILYHSYRPLSIKRAAYATLLDEFADDSALAGHLQRNILKIDRAMDAPNRDPVQGHIFTASIERTIPKKDANSFSSYAKAKQWLNLQRLGVRETNRPTFYTQSIVEFELDTGLRAAGWYFDEQGEMCSFDDVDLTAPAEDAPPEARYVHLPDVFAPGELLRLRPAIRNKHQTGYAVVPFGFDERVQLTSIPADYHDVRVLVMRYDVEDEYVWHDCWTLWDTERFDGDLPESQKILLDVARHFKEEEQLGADVIRLLDPDQSFHWERNKGMQACAGAELYEGDEKDA